MNTLNWKIQFGTKDDEEKEMCPASIETNYESFPNSVKSLRNVQHRQKTEY